MAPCSPPINPRDRRKKEYIDHFMAPTSTHYDIPPFPAHARQLGGTILARPQDPHGRADHTIAVSPTPMASGLLR